MKIELSDELAEDLATAVVFSIRERRRWAVMARRSNPKQYGVHLAFIASMQVVLDKLGDTGKRVARQIEKDDE